MRFFSTDPRVLAWLALGLMSPAWSQPLPSDPAAVSSQLSSMTDAAPANPLPARLEAAPQRLEQAWDVIAVMGKPVPAGERGARIVLRGQGSLLVDGGCNYFSGRYEHDSQGTFRVSKYTGTHDACGNPPRSEAVLNSALLMVNNYRWDRGLVLLSGDGELVRLQPSANQDSRELEQGLARRPAAAAAQEAAEPPCHPVQAGKLKKGKAAKSRKAHDSACSPAKAASAKSAHAGAKATGKSRATKLKAAKGRQGGKSTTRPVAKSSARSRKRSH